MNFTKFITLLFFIFCTYSCQKKTVTPEEQLPDAHNSDSPSVFGCLVDGEVWKARNGVISFNVISYSYNTTGIGGFNINAIRKNSDRNIDESIILNSSFKDTGRYELIEGVFIDLDTDCWEYEDEKSIEDYIHIDSLNTDARVIIGRFQFTGIHTTCQDTVRVTDGRFKATY